MRGLAGLSGLGQVKSSPFAGMVLSGLLAWWKFDEGSGSTAADSSGNGHDGTITDATYDADAAPVSFPNPYSLSFNGTSAFVDIGAAVAALQPTSYTYCLWLKRAGTWTGVEQHLVNNWFATAAPEYYGTLISFSTPDDKLRLFNGLGTS